MMQVLLSIFLFFIILPLNLAGRENCYHDDHNFRCVRYIKNYDADTITFEIPLVHPLLGKNISIRVNGVDTPEIRTKNKCEKEKARSAKKLVQNLFKNAKKIDLVNVKRGKYFRILADVIVDGKSLSFYILKNGLGVNYDGGAKKKVDWCMPNRMIASKNSFDQIEK